MKKLRQLSTQRIMVAKMSQKNSRTAFFFVFVFWFFVFKTNNKINRKKKNWDD